MSQKTARTQRQLAEIELLGGGAVERINKLHEGEVATVTAKDTGATERFQKLGGRVFVVPKGMPAQKYLHLSIRRKLRR